MKKYITATGIGTEVWYRFYTYNADPAAELSRVTRPLQFTDTLAAVTSLRNTAIDRNEWVSYDYCQWRTVSMQCSRFRTWSIYSGVYYIRRGSSMYYFTHPDAIDIMRESRGPYANEVKTAEENNER